MRVLDDTYTVVHELPDNAEGNTVECILKNGSAYKDVSKLIEKVMDIVYLPEKFFDNEYKSDIIKVKCQISKL